MNLQELREHFNTYKFIDGTVDGEASQMSEANNIVLWPAVDRTYSDKHQWFFIVLAPYKIPYKKDPQWYNQYSVDKGRKWAAPKCSAYYVTKEIDASMTHVNILCCSTQDLQKHHQKHCYNKYKIHVSSLSTLGDRQRVLSYINKEREKRTFKLYSDYYHTNK